MAENSPKTFGFFTILSVEEKVITVKSSLTYKTFVIEFMLSRLFRYQGGGSLSVVCIHTLVVCDARV